MTKAEFATAIQREFDTRLQAKTGWGRNEVSSLLRDVIRDIALDLMDEGPSATGQLYGDTLGE